MTIIQAQPLKQFGISGPASALDNEMPVFDGVTGKKIKAATGIICPSSGRLKFSSTAPDLTLHNTTHEDPDYGRESEIIFKGEQSGGEETTLGKIQVAHDGTADDQKGIMSFKVNDGTEADAPGTAMTILANGNVGIGTDNPDIRLHLMNGSAGTVSHNPNTMLGLETNGNTYFSMLSPNTGVTGLIIGDNDDNAVAGFEYQHSDNHFHFKGNNWTSRLVIGSTGNIGIGTTDPSAKLDINSDIIRLRTAKTPASTGAAGSQGDECWDADFHYRCVATNTWKRTALTTW